MRSAALFAIVFVAGCPRGEPPAPAGIDASVAPLHAPVASGSTAVTVTAAAAVDASSPSTSSSADASATTKSADVPDAGDTGAQPQTKERAKAEGELFAARSAALWDAIVHDDPDRGMPFFFPLSAYKQVKDVGSPEGDWRHRLVAAYKRDIHALHARLGDKADSAKLVRFDVPDDRAKWVEPDEEYNKLGYWRVYGTRIVYTSGDSTRERSFEVSSLISWRGQWFVVHLTGFK